MTPFARLGLSVIALCALTLASPSEKFSSALVGDKECTEGPSYWCQNFTTSRQCNANQHCIRTVWEYMRPTVPDNSDICDVCKKMVDQARSELRSNITQENLKLVLEGSCTILIPIKILAHECIKAVDEFIPELIEALASQMDPQVVCAVAGLCNSARLDKLTAQYQTQDKERAVVDMKLDCENCVAVAGAAEKNFRSASRDEVLNSMLEICGRMSSYSDACSSVVITQFNRLYEALATNLYPQGVCHLSGVCHSKYHSHSTEIEIKPVPELKGDEACELCEQLVQHLKDILVANTTEKEFEQVLLGICKQTGNFAKECVNLVETYYPAIYALLTTELDGKMICAAISICPTPTFISPLNPLLPVNVADSLEKTSSGLHRVPISTSGVSVHSGQHSLQTAEAVLPLDTLTVVPQNKDLCQMCNLMLHFLQQEVTDPKTEESVKEAAEEACTKLPDKFTPTCRAFVDTYTNTIMALLAQDIDPSQICPKIGVCPGFSNSQVECEPCKTTTLGLVKRIGGNTTEVHIKDEIMTLCLSLEFEDSLHCNQIVGTHHDDLTDMVIAEFTGEEMCFFMKYCPIGKMPVLVGGNTDTNEMPVVVKNVGGQLCTMCEFMLTTLETALEDNKTEVEIREVAEHVCYLMPSTVRNQCIQFVDKYCDLIVTLLAESINPQEICSLLKMCPSHIAAKGTIQNTKEIVVKNTDNVGGQLCTMCEFVMTTLEKDLQDNKTEAEIRNAVEHVCYVMPSTVRSKCKKFVDQYCDLIVTLLAQSVDPQEICSMLGLCTSLTGVVENVQKSITECVVCESLMGSLMGIMADPTIDADINHKLELACMRLPHAMRAQCQDIVHQMAPQIENILQELPVGVLVCRRLGMCVRAATLELEGKSRCHEGEQYWCQSTMHAAMCQKIEFCQSNVWFADKPSKKMETSANEFYN